MFLKSLDIFGFKSFADRTHIEFAPGITALLGPNGCGKSNVVDAVKWVLGEQSSKTMRAEKMEDVIFNGTESRKALNVAEVTLTISNEQNLLNLELNEIAIKRRLYRSGEAEYFINNQQVKLKDIRELFMDTGVGKAAYSVMEQGKIDQILSSKPEDRRYLFEEAAGISRFKMKRAEAERKLTKTEENMTQIELILNEVKRSYDVLKVQSEKTLKYRSYKDDIFNLELDMHLLRLRGFIQDKSRYAEEVAVAEKKRNDVMAEIEAVTAKLTENMDEVNAIQQKIVSIQSETIRMQQEQNQKNELIKIYRDQLNEIKAKVGALESKKLGIEEKIGMLEDDADEQEAVLHDLHKRLTDIQKNIASFEQNITIASGTITDNDKRAAEYEQYIRNLELERGDLEKELGSITDDIVAELDSRLKNAGYSSQAHKSAYSEVTAILEKIAVFAGGRKNIFADFARIHSPSESDIHTFSENAVNAFTDIENLISELRVALESYSQSSPDFIDDFLSPEGIITKKRAIDLKIQDNKNAVEEKRSAITALKSENADLVTKIDEYKQTLEELRINKVKMQGQVYSAEEQLKFITREITGQKNALTEVENELYTETKRLEDNKTKIEDLESEIADIDYRGKKMMIEMESLEKEVLSLTSDVAGSQESVKSKQEELSKTQVKVEKLHLSLATSETEIRNVQENFRDTHSRDLMEFEERMYTINSAIPQMREGLSVMKQKMKELGNVNFMAPEEFAETKERYEFLSNQLADLQKARDDLKRITEEIRAESTELFLETYNKIKKNFHNMFRRLFGGGRAELRLTDPMNVLESGIDIFAQPPGKKLENIALLSGGERTMTAVSLLFATYMVRPSPFCLLDEIDAALDEQNVTRFVSTLRTFANVSQYIVITHNKKTVAGSGTLLGVTMEESGITKVVTIKLESTNEDGTVVPAEIEPFEDEDVAPEEGVFIPPHPPKRQRKVEE